MSGLVMTLRTTAQRPGRVLAVWSFCVAAIAFWAAVIQYLGDLPIVAVVLVAAVFGLLAIPFAGKVAYIVWEGTADG